MLQLSAKAAKAESTQKEEIDLGGIVSGDGVKPNNMFFSIITDDIRHRTTERASRRTCSDTIPNVRKLGISELNTPETFRIRPAGRHILTIGRDLIQDEVAAVIELVKNAFDADSPGVKIRLSAANRGDNIRIDIQDNGHGMSREIIINSWLVPSTDDKLRRKTSPNGRLMQGRKGVGRYAASILGNDLKVTTITPGGELTTVEFQWDDFENAKYLDDVEITVSSQQTNQLQGTTLSILGNKGHLANWSSSRINQLKHELKKLISPVESIVGNESSESNFSIELTLDGLGDSYSSASTEKIEPFPIFDLFDYRISGTIDANGKGTLAYTNQKAPNTVREELSFDFGKRTECGSLAIDVRAYDRDAEAIDQLIHRGLKDEKGNYVGKLQARQLLNHANGIGVFRNGFRVRPLGDADFDWLKLNEQRIQNPSLRIGSNQVIGYVGIESEESSSLEEKSARDGLRDNYAYRNLRKIVQLVIAELETRRFEYRRKVGLNKSGLKIERELERMFHFDDLRDGVLGELKKAGVGNEVSTAIIGVISADEQQRNQLADDVRQAVAVYQRQATLGKIINVILHEARRPLNYFKNQIPNIEFWAQEIRQDFRIEILDELLPITEGIGRNSQVFVDLFGRLDPLAAARPGAKKEFPLKKTIDSSTKVFEEDLIRNKIALKIEGPDDLTFLGWPSDIYAIFTNLIDNSLFWIVEKKSKLREITIVISESDGELGFIDYRDTGPGIASHLITGNLIFEPNFSTKPSGLGQGLGLAISGEAAARNGLNLIAFESDSGAYFRIRPQQEED